MKSTVVDSFSRDLMKNCKLPTITIYEKPKDYPNHFVARLFDREPTEYIIVKDTIEELRELIPFGMVPFQRSPHDDAVIVETYI